MILKNSTSPKTSNQAKEKDHINYDYEECFKRENKSFLNDSEFIDNYNNALKSPQSRRLYKSSENEIPPDSIKGQNILPLNKISI